MNQASAPVDPSTILWERMAGLRLHLRDTVSVHEHRYRGRHWYLLRDTLGKQQYRLSQGVYQLIARLDGRQTLAEAYARFTAGRSTQVDPQPELLSTLTQLHAAGLLAADSLKDVGPLIAQQRQQRRKRNLSRWLRLLSPRMPLVDPDAFLGRTLPWVRWFFHPAALAVWLLLAGVAGLQALMHWDALALYGAQRLDDPQSWLLLVCVYPLVKGLHELGHGFAAKSSGAEVNEMGVTLLVFLPVPYVDASAASVLESKYRRMLVGAAGIIVELLLAALAMFAWLQLSDGLLREAAFAVMLIGGVSTLLFNGNPLLRFDGYYVLSDAIEIPNLATRAARYYGYLTRRYLLGIAAERAPNTASGERRWLLFFGAASTLYRLSITIGIALFLIAVVPTLGVVMAAWLLTAQLALPVGRQLNFLFFSPALAGRRLRALLTVGGLITGGLLLLALVPVPSSTKADGVVLLPEQAIVRAGVDGFLDRQLVVHGGEVRRGDVLFVLSNRQLEADIAVLEARVAELGARHDAVAFDDRLARDIHAERLYEARRELSELQERRDRLTVSSPGDGLLQVPHTGDRLGRLVSQGDLLAYIADESDARVRVVATQEDASRIRESVESIRVRPAGVGAGIVEGRLLQEVPAASDTLPSAVLGSRGGGAIQVDARDERGLKTLHKVFAFDIAVPFNTATQYVGSRAYVRFEHPARPLLARWYDSGRRLLMEQIGE